MISVLLVDHAVDEREMYAEFLQHAGYRTLQAHNAAIAARAAIERHPDLIVTDAILPHEDGLALTKRLKSDERTRRIPVIVLTGRMIDRTATASADRVLMKPCLPDALVREIEHLLRSSHKLRVDASRRPRRTAKARLRPAAIGKSAAARGRHRRK